LTERSARRRAARREEQVEGIYLHHPSGQSPICAPESVAEVWLEHVTGLGFFAGRITEPEDFPREAAELEEFLRQGRHGDMDYLGLRLPDGALARERPSSLLPGAKSVLVVGLPYPPAPGVPLRRSRDGADLTGQVARYAGGRDYHHVLKERLLLLADTLADLIGRPVLARACVDTALVFERQLAERAGLVFLGKNTLAIVPGVGSYFHLAVLVVDLELAVAVGASVPEGCGRCRACLDACPTGALDAEYRIDARRCISYLTIEHDGVVPRELRRGIGRRVFGCDECQAVCPYNRTASVLPADPELETAEFWQEPELEAVLNLSANGYRRHVRRTALQRATRAQLARNAVIALGNSGARAAVPILASVLASERPVLVQVHAAWALGELWHEHGHREAEAVLVAHAEHPQPDVRAEVHVALARRD
jgi:epoxyqueuosine reductase